jgi:hypothetical protein
MIDATGSYVFNKKINFPKLCAARINNNSGMTSSFFLLLFFNDRSHHSCCLDIFTVSRFSIMMENETRKNMNKGHWWSAGERCYIPVFLCQTLSHSTVRRVVFYCPRETDREPGVWWWSAGVRPMMNETWQFASARLSISNSSPTL